MRFVFITIACGALSGFHALISSGTTPKMVAKESHVRMIGYGGMLMESFVAISALIAASAIDQGFYFAMNSPAGATGGEPASAAEFVRGLGFTITPGDLTAAAQSIEESTLISRTGGAPTLAFGISLVFTDAFGGGLAAPRSTRGPGSGASCSRTPSATSGPSTPTSPGSPPPGRPAPSSSVCGATWCTSE